MENEREELSPEAEKVDEIMDDALPEKLDDDRLGDKQEGDESWPDPAQAG